ncbi:DUF1653 domain-containing protein [Pelosinus sp. sgz500959]|uniref:DUF1653 domain-containing protein n=1 Tax=Pelosinus sp. sgz500959 TaxID=3242472 RepID=UPI00366A8637
MEKLEQEHCQSTVIKKGLYRHYKNKLYEVLDEATHSESLEVMIIYRALYGNYGLWVRPKKMFLEEVLYEGVKVPRFSYLGENGESLICFEWSGKKSY